jgi:hypothetical protein
VETRGELIKCGFNIEQDTRFDDYAFMSISYLVKHIHSNYPYHFLIDIPAKKMFTPLLLAEMYAPGNVKVHLPPTLKAQRTMMMSIMIEFASSL